MRYVENLTERAADAIIQAAFGILEESGVRVEHREITETLVAFGGCMGTDGRIRFSKKMLVQLLATGEKAACAEEMKLLCAAEIYQGLFWDPEDDLLKPWNEERMLCCLRLSRILRGVDDFSMLGCPLAEVPRSLEPLYEKYYGAKYGFTAGGAVWDTALCEAIYEMNLVIAAEKGKPPAETFGAGVFLISPLIFGKVEAEQFWYFYSRGLKPFLGYLGSVGGTAPVTLAGAVSLQLAEALFVNLMNRCFFGVRTLAIDGSMAVLDMATARFCYGRPEQTAVNLAMAQLARRLGAESAGHTGYSDSPVPGAAAAHQKMSGALLTACGGARAHMAAGLLQVDEVFSPVQMIYDGEAVDAARKAVEKMEVSSHTLAADCIRQAVKQGSFLEEEHSAENCRSLWRPFTGNRSRSDNGKMREREERDSMLALYRELLQKAPQAERQISPEAERELLKIIEKQKKQ